MEPKWKQEISHGIKRSIKPSSSSFPTPCHKGSFFPHIFNHLFRLPHSFSPPLVRAHVIPLIFGIYFKNISLIPNHLLVYLNILGLIMIYLLQYTSFLVLLLILFFLAFVLVKSRFFKYKPWLCKWADVARWVSIFWLRGTVTI